MEMVKVGDSTLQADNQIFCDVCKAEMVWNKWTEKHYCRECAERANIERETAEREAARLKALRRDIAPKFWDADLAHCSDKVEAVRVAKKWAENPKGIVLIYGKCGRGKSYLVSAIKKEFNRQSTKSRLICGDNVLLELKRAYNAGSDRGEYEIYKRYESPEPLIIDDVGVEKTSEWTMEVWEKIVERRYREDAPTLITSNYSVDELETRIGIRATERIREYNNIHEYIGENRRKVT